jgi:hypothetical protein
MSPTIWAGVEALVLGRGILAVPFLAALVDRLEERVVEAFDHDHELLLFLSHRRAGERKRCRRGEQKYLLHVVLPLSGWVASIAAFMASHGLPRPPRYS